MGKLFNRRSDFIAIAIGVTIAIVGFLIKRQICAMEVADTVSMNHIEILKTLGNEHEIRIVLLEKRQTEVLRNQELIITGIEKIDRKLR
jgi:ribosomal protein L6P/L9E